jgi:asparagine synthase (glutamine-hydrolysing)
MIRMQGIAGPALAPADLAWARSASPFSGATFGAATFSAAPMRNADASGAIHCDDTLLVIANARLDDLAELRRALGKFAPADPASGPAVHIAAAWHRWGSDCPQHLYGDYVFVLHDHSRGETFCARDHIGARALWYVLEGQRLAFADSIPPFLTLPGFDLELDESYVATALTVREFEPHRTFYRALRKLPAGHTLQLTANGPHLSRWWRPEQIAVRHGIADEEAVAETCRLVGRAIDERIAGHERVGLHVSGGIDSSLVAVLAARSLRGQGKPDPFGYCWQDPEGEASHDNEIGWVRAMAGELGIEPIAPRLAAQELADLLLADWTRGPDAKNLFHELPIQCHAEAKGVTLILSGWGGDEGFSFHGRGMNPRLLLTGRWPTLFKEAATTGIRAGLREFYGAGRRFAIDWLRPRKSAADLIARGKSVIHPDFARHTSLLPLPRIREFGVQATQIALLRHGSPTSRIEDWAVSGAEHGTEYGYPLLDRRLLEWVLSLPPRMFKRRGRDRWLAREVSKGLLPELIRTNTSKNELVRVGQLDRDLANAYRLIATKLDDPATPLTRARYIDMPALRRELAAMDSPKSGLGRGKRTAIQFLDFE